MAKRAIRIANCSGAIGDGIDQIYRLALAGGIDALTADYLAEFNIAWRAIDQQTDPSAGYEGNFLQQLAWHNGDAARLLAEKKIKVVHDGGALNPKGLAEAADAYFRSLGITTVKIAWVEGDNLSDRVRNGTLDAELKHLDLPGVVLTGNDISAMLTANAYTGQTGVMAALAAGADIVVCGRCTDASPVMGLASWWHGWSATDYDALAGSLIAGHVIECGPQATGGNFAGIFEFAEIHDLGFPIVEIAADGSFVVTKNPGTGGAVTINTVSAQLMYEIQGPYYLNPDVTLHMESIKAEQVAEDRVLVSGVKGSAPPPTTKLAVCLLGGWQAELLTFAAGLDTEAKFQQMKQGVMKRINMDDFTVFSIERYGTSPADPKSQAEATVMMRFFAQTPKKEALAQLGQGIFFNGLQGYAGMHTSMDWRTLVPRQYVRYFPALVSQSLVPLQVHLMNEGGAKAGPAKVIDVPARDASLCADKAATQPNYGPTVEMPTFEGGTVRRPLGDVVFTRSGDKGGNSNIGFWVRDEAAYPWLKAFMTSERAQQLLGNDWRDSYKIERCEFPNLRAVHILVRGILQDGVSSSSVLDGFGKSVGEFMRSRHVDIPKVLVEAEDARRTAAYSAVGRTYSPSG
ncbi:hypothetical protein SBRCBS47491_003875 [Sporothrix bragantina]|uniref:DUF1446 domain-containing protein n=1 Tax=Sporothrix bragantina TaxID=671064 RepID=A0ABP0BIP5_9PEZI